MPTFSLRWWCIECTRRLTRDDTFEKLVAPAIADLQREGRDWKRRSRHYPGLLLVLAIAFLRDLHLDVTELFGAAARRVWAATAAWYLAGAATIAAAVVWTTPLHLLGTTGRLSSTASAFVVGLVAAMPLCAAPAAFHLQRRQPLGPRQFAAALGSFIVMTTMVHLAALPGRSALNRATYASMLEISREAVLPSDSGQGYLAAEAVKWALWRESLRSDVANGLRFPPPADPVGRVASEAHFLVNQLPVGFGTAYLAIYATGMVPLLLVFGLSGVALSRGRGLTVCLRALGLVTSVVGLQYLMATVFGVSHLLIVMLVVATGWTFYARLPWWKPQTCPDTGSPQ